MARALTVKVATPKVIKALEDKLASIKKSYETQEANEAKYAKAVEKWNKEVVKIALDSFKSATNVRTNVKSWNDTVNVDFDIPLKGLTIPEEPKREHEVLVSWRYENMVEEITNALSILKMTDDEFVNASTMKSIAQYL